MRKQYFIFLSVLSLLFACADDRSDSSDGELQTGEVALQLNASAGKTGIEISGASKADGNGSPLDINDFSIQILNTNQAVVKSWARYAEMPAKVKLNVGNYKLRAFYGDAAISGFDLPYFLGETPFTVVGQQTQQLDVTCKLANSKVAVVYGENIKRDYTDFRVEIISPANANEIVTYSKDETRAAYLPSGDLQLKIYMTDEENVTRTYMPPVVPAAPQDFLTLKIDSKDTQGPLSMTVTTKSETIDKEVTTDIPAWMLPKAAPSMTFDGFDATTGIYTNVEGVIPNTQVNIRADGMISSCIVTVSPTLQTLGWPNGFDLANLPAGTNTILKEKGLVWFEAMKGEILANINLSTVASQLPATTEPVSYGFTVKVTDLLGQTAEKSVTLTITPPVIALEAIPAGNVWASKVENISFEVTSGNMDLTVLQYKAGSGAWTNSVTADRTVSGTKISMTTKSLPLSESATPVAFRVQYNNHYSNEVSATLEPAVQVPNSNFSTYCEYKYNSGNDINQYYWYAAQDTQDKWWATRNPASASQLTGAKNGYTRNNGTTPVDNGSYGKAVEMKTTAWGRGCTSFVNGGGTKFNITASVLFIGSYSYTLEENTSFVGNGKMTSETITQGHTFTSRPARLQFQYKYAPRSNESFQAYAVIENRDNGVVELGRATVPAATAAQAIGTMTNLSLDFVYNPDHKNLRATHISIFFASSTKMGWKEDEDRPATTNSGTGTLHYGSILTVDEVYLDYNF